MPPTPKIKQYKNIKRCKNKNRQKHVILQGFSQNGLQIRIQRICLHMLTLVKVFFRDLFENDIFDIRIIKNCIIWIVLKAWDYAQTICNSEKIRISYIKAENDTRKHIF